MCGFDAAVACFATGVAAACPVACARPTPTQCNTRACNGHKIICGCISLVNDVGDASFCTGCMSTLLRTLPPPHVASWQSLLRDGFIRRQKLRRHRWNWTSSWRPFWRLIISTRGRSHLLKAAKVRLGQFRILKPDTKNESTTNTRLTTHYSPSASPQPSPSAAS